MKTQINFITMEQNFSSRMGKRPFVNINARKIFSFMFLGE